MNNNAKIIIYVSFFINIRTYNDKNKILSEIDVNLNHIHDKKIKNKIIKKINTDHCKLNIAFSYVNGIKTIIHKIHYNENTNNIEIIISKENKMEFTDEDCDDINDIPAMSICFLN